MHTEVVLFHISTYNHFNKLFQKDIHFQRDEKHHFKLLFIKSKSSSKDKDKKKRKIEHAKDKKSRGKDPEGGRKSHNRHRPTSSARYGSQFHLCLLFHCVNCM